MGKQPIEFLAMFSSQSNSSVGTKKKKEEKEPMPFNMKRQQGESQAGLLIKKKASMQRLMEGRGWKPPEVCSQLSHGLVNDLWPVT